MSDSRKPEYHLHQDGFATRLRQSLTHFGSPGGLAKLIGRSEGAVRKWMRGDSEPNVSDLRAICEHTGANVEWLVTGRGERQSNPTELKDPASSYPSTGTVPIDYGFLGRVMDAADEELMTSGIQIEPLKRSSMVVTLYQLFRESRDIDREAVTRVVRLAG